MLNYRWSHNPPAIKGNNLSVGAERLFPLTGVEPTPLSWGDWERVSRKLWSLVKLCQKFESEIFIKI